MIVDFLIKAEQGIMISVNVNEKTNNEKCAWNSSIFSCKCGKNYNVGKYSKDCTCTKILVDDLLVTCDEVVYTPEITSIEPQSYVCC